MFSNKIKVDKELYKKACEYAEKTGYSSVEEFVNHLIEKEVSSTEDNSEEAEEIKKKLQGLGYIS